MWLVALACTLILGVPSLSLSVERPSAHSIMENYIDVLSRDVGFKLIGEEFTPITTTLGHIKDKEMALDPRFAVIMSNFFNRIGLVSGDAVAIGASGSFPGLLLAVLAACESMELRPLLICSLGSSMYGANRPGATIVDMVRCLYPPSKVDSVFLGFSLGGGGDRGDGALFPEWEGALMDEARRLGGRLIMEKDLSSSVFRRMELYVEAAGERGIGCFVGVGGAAVTFGVGDAAAAFPNGITEKPFDGMPKEGLLSGFLKKGVPVIHLLCVRSLLDGA